MNERRSVYDGYRPEAQLVEVVAVDFLRGEGDGPHNTMRRVIAYFDKDGKFLAENDPCAELLAGSAAPTEDPRYCHGCGSVHDEDDPAEPIKAGPATSTGDDDG